MASGKHHDIRQKDGSRLDSCIRSPVTYGKLRNDLEVARQEIEREIYEKLENSSISTRDPDQIDVLPKCPHDRTKACRRTFTDPDYAYTRGIPRDSGGHGLMICIPKEVITELVRQDDGKNINVSRRLSVCHLVNVQVAEELPKNRVWVEMTGKREPTEHTSSASTISTDTVKSEGYVQAKIFTRDNETTRRSPVQHSDDNNEEYESLKFEFDALACPLDEALKDRRVAEFLLNKTNNFDIKLTQWEYDYQAPVLLEKFPWYHKNIDHTEAKQRLKEKEVGTFLVRQAAQTTADPNHKFTMEIVSKDKRIIRLRIMHRDGLYNFEDSNQEGVVDVWKLIVQATERGLDISKPGEDWTKITPIPLSNRS
ncbi:uncharacterized protein LOC128210265 [Mya arenaria]|uniref:uncharacterized protein LOC128210265 n=1 Tax=Mya arenaria TaxID=6604 RepID=UPI0022E88DD3|nr:uncharacterized protein LOC128210265 [Mya arenaria]